MANIKEALAASTSITITMGTLANGSAREATAIDNSTNLYLDALVRISATLAVGAPASDQVINVYAAGSEDGTNYTDNATGLDAAITLRSPTNLILIGIISTPTSGALTYQGGPWAVAGAFGGILPRKWSIIVENRTGLAFTAATATFSGVSATSI